MRNTGSAAEVEIASNQPADCVPYIERTRALYASQGPYRWTVNDRESDPVPWTPLRRPLRETRVALISSSGVYRDDQEPFHFRNDCSHREIPVDTPSERMRVAHFGYDTRDAQRDPSCIFPLGALRELASEGVIGSVADPALTFMGGIYSARRVRDELAPRLADIVLQQRADLAFLVPA